MIMSIAIKTTLVFFLVVIVIHLMIKKVLTERFRPFPPQPPPQPHVTQEKEGKVVDESFEKQPVNVSQPKKEDDLFDFVFKSKVQQQGGSEEALQLLPPSGPTHPEGICTFDESGGVYGEFKSSSDARN